MSEVPDNFPKQKHPPGLKININTTFEIKKEDSKHINVDKNNAGSDK